MKYWTFSIELFDLIETDGENLEMLDQLRPGRDFMLTFDLMTWVTAMLSLNVGSIHLALTYGSSALSRMCTSWGQFFTTGASMSVNWNELEPTKTSIQSSVILAINEL